MSERSLEERKCNLCGKCCKDFTLPVSAEEVAELIKPPQPGVVPKYSDDTIEFLKAVNFLYEKKWSDTSPEVQKIHRYHYSCNNFVQLEDGTGYCGIHETRSRVCKSFPFPHPYDSDYMKQEFLKNNSHPSVYRGCTFNINDDAPPNENTMRPE